MKTGLSFVVAKIWTLETTPYRLRVPHAKIYKFWNLAFKCYTIGNKKSLLGFRRSKYYPKNVCTFPAAQQNVKIWSLSYNSLPHVQVLCFAAAAPFEGAGKWSGAKKNYGNYKISLVHILRLTTSISRAQLTVSGMRRRELELQGWGRTRSKARRDAGRRKARQNRNRNLSTGGQRGEQACHSN